MDPRGGGRIGAVTTPTGDGEHEQSHDSSAEDQWRPSAAPPTVLQGERVLLRAWHLDDAGPLDALVSANIAHLTPFMPWASEHSRAAIEQFLQGSVQGWEQCTSFGYALVSRAEGVLVGGCGMHVRRGPHVIELGYWLDAAHTGQGLMTEAAGLLTVAALEMPDVETVEIHHDVRNVASGGIPQRLGYERVGEAPKKFTELAPGESGVHVAWRFPPR